MKTGSTTGCYSVSGKARSLAGMACMAAGLLLAAPAGAFFGTNLIVNPGAEAGAGNANGDAVGEGNIPGWSNSAEFTVVAYGPDFTFPESTSPGPLDRGFNFFAGGPDNPLGSRALYLFQNGRDTYYRIHGTNQPASIGRSVSNGCIRMINAHVQDLYERVPIGTVVTVL